MSSVHARDDAAQDEGPRRGGVGSSRAPAPAGRPPCRAIDCVTSPMSSVQPFSTPRALMATKAAIGRATTGPPGAARTDPRTARSRRRARLRDEEHRHHRDADVEEGGDERADERGARNVARRVAHARGRDHGALEPSIANSASEETSRPHARRRIRAAGAACRGAGASGGPRTRGAMTAKAGSSFSTVVSICTQPASARAAQIDENERPDQQQRCEGGQPRGAPPGPARRSRT